MNRAPPSRVRDPHEAVRSRLAEDDVVRILLRQRVAGLVERGRQAGLADHIRRSAGPLAVEEVGGSHCRRPDRLLGNVERIAPQSRCQVARRIHRVVRENEEGRAPFSQPLEKALGARNRMLLANEDPVHVDEPRRDRVHHVIATYDVGVAGALVQPEEAGLRVQRERVLVLQ
jgi:hypothetical protein